MGLDMYLEGRVRSYRSYGETKVEEGSVRHVLEQAAEKIGLPASDNIDFIELSREVAYWRKANHIHKWFVDNVQNGTDDCGHYYVDRDQLRALRDLCQRVIDGSQLVDTGETMALADDSLAKQLLPTASGFFFGGTEYDEWYLDDLKRTVEMLDKALALPAEVEFQYHSSW